MPKFEFSRLALADLKAISRYTIRNWGVDQALRYLDELQECVRKLGESPSLGRACEGTRAGYRRMEHGRHVIFYRQQSYGILIVRVLHQRMLPRIHIIE